ncbi:hypothetical protein LCX93_01410 [Sulfurimonas sp. SWIR-19]|uniref:hypothetical protein n=1 Tax=Sulfurimonas sp. SWIR-19 TaxID=2878390 RepID=UPI001CF42D53|nr:hypothetical protein [Sulfurimonas sp. SWIR-19]UCN00601.1 hypothetical protein LCX93_01410 [Sulfurimonas sp. SWIR-19]
MSVAKLKEDVQEKEFIKDLYFLARTKKNLGWKHTKFSAKYIQDGINYITLTKNPYSWLLSLYKKPYHQYYKNFPQTFEEFLQVPWKTVHRDGIGYKVLTSPVELWNIKNRAYMDVQVKNILRLKSEMLFEDPQEIIHKIASSFSITKKEIFFKNYEQSTKNSSLTFKDYQTYYLQERWKEKLSSRAIEIINASLDRELMSIYKYEIL